MNTDTRLWQIYILLEPYTENKTTVITQKYGEKNKKRN